MEEKKRAIIIGAGPAGLTAALELLRQTDVVPIVLEASDMVGGISRTVNYKGNRIDIGGHRFFSKSDRVMKWWQEILPLAEGRDPEKEDKLMLERPRVSHMLFLGKFFSYPVSLSKETLLNLGPVRVIRISITYVWARIFPVRKEKSLEDFFVNRFGRELYNTFFKNYTEKLWGIPASKISPDWGAQRVKGVSLSKAVIHAIRGFFKKKGGDVSQKDVETSLIGRFIYPKYGPGQMWEEVARKVKEKGGQVLLNEKVSKIEYRDGKIASVTATNQKTGEEKKHEGDHFVSTMPVRSLIRGMGNEVPEKVKAAAAGLVYRDFVTAGLLLKKLCVGKDRKEMLPDTWIYVHEPEVKAGRIQIFNNWCPHLVRDPNTAWIGLEYFCDKGDELWNKSDEEFLRFATEEMVKIKMINREDVVDSTIIRMEKTYPCYFGTYDDFGAIREFTNGIENLFLIGRNGMHRYNNQDHSMLTAMAAVENIATGKASKENIWEVNAEEEYHEKK